LTAEGFAVSIPMALPPGSARQDRRLSEFAGQHGLCRSISYTRPNVKIDQIIVYLMEINMEISMLSLKRSHRFFGMFRKLKIYVDNKLIGYVKDNQIFEAEVPVGIHHILVRMDWGQSLGRVLKLLNGREGQPLLE